MKSFLKKLPELWREYGKLFLLFFLGLLILFSGVLALRFLLPSWVVKGGKTDTVQYIIFGQKTKYSREEMQRDGADLVDLGEISRFCGFHISGSQSEVCISTDSGEQVELKDGDNSVRINGTYLRMETYASVNGARVLVPLSFAEKYVTGITCTWNEEHTELTVSRSTDSGAVLSFLLKGENPPEKISSAGIPKRISVDSAELDYEFLTDVSAYLRYMNPEDADACLVLCSPTSVSAETDVPPSLTAVRKGSTLQLSENAAKSLEAMLAEMSAVGIKNVKATHAYMSYASQKKNYDNRVFNERYYFRYHPEAEGTYFTDLTYSVLGKSYLQTAYISKGTYSLTEADAERVAKTVVAAPGTSDHQTGLGADLSLGNSADKSFAQTEAYAWLKENAYKFGFIERYPEEAVKMTGFSYEPYHWRFVGQYHAAVMHREGYSCLEEYLAVLGLD